MVKHYALIEEGGRVAQVEKKPFAVAEPLKWVECGADVQPEWIYDGLKFESAKVIDQPIALESP